MCQSLTEHVDRLIDEEPRPLPAALPTFVRAAIASFEAEQRQATPDIIRLLEQIEGWTEAAGR
jgi:hypothetical protein